MQWLVYLFLHQPLVISSDFEQDDDAFTGESSTVSSKVVVFEERSYSSKPSALGSRAQMKAFMVSIASNYDHISYLPSPQSSKVSKLRQDIPGAPDTEKTEEDKEDERCVRLSITDFYI